MKIVQRYKCSYCQKLTVKQETMEKHEKECRHNPNGKNCYMCANSYEGDYDNSEYSTIRNAPICAYNEEILTPHDALKCEGFVRSDDMYYLRSEDSKFPCNKECD